MDARIKSGHDEAELGRVLINRGLRARLDPCPLSGALQTQIGHLLMSEECQLRTHVS
jgi:hypothetical protein